MDNRFFQFHIWYTVHTKAEQRRQGKSNTVKLMNQCNLYLRKQNLPGESFLFHWYPQIPPHLRSYQTSKEKKQLKQLTTGKIENQHQFNRKQSKKVMMKKPFSNPKIYLNELSTATLQSTRWRLTLTLSLLTAPSPKLINFPTLQTG